MLAREFLVVARDEDEVFASMWTARRILDYMDMEDCHSFDEIHVYDVMEIGKVKELTLYGAWHDFKRPLYMKAVDENGNIVFDGWGTDH